MHYAQLELDRIYSNKRPLHVQQQEKMDPVLVLENAYHLTSLDAQNEVGHHFHGKGGNEGWGKEIYPLCTEQSITKIHPCIYRTL